MCCSNDCLSEFLDKYPGYNLASTYAVNRGASKYCVGDDCDKTSGCTFKDSTELENFKNLGESLSHQHNERESGYQGLVGIEPSPTQV